MLVILSNLERLSIPIDKQRFFGEKERFVLVLQDQTDSKSGSLSGSVVTW